MRDAWHLPRWPLAGAVRAVTTVRAGGASRGAFREFNLGDHVGDDPAAVAANRAALARETGVAAIQWLAQVHGTRCVAASSATVATVPEADAAWTSEPGLALAVLTADCLPVVVADRRGSVVGLAHGGWRGLTAGVLETLVDRLAAPAGDLAAWIGPGIGPDAYEVGDDVADAVSAALGGGADVLRPGRAPGRYQLDLYGLATRLLARRGVTEVYTERLCTFEDGRFYSYRRDGATGRMATLAWLPVR